MAAPQTTLFTVADYLATPDERRYQLIEGELILMEPAPTPFHQRVQINLLVALEIFLRQHPLGTVLSAPCDVYLDDHNVYQPDVLYVTREHADRIRRDGVYGAPDLVVEILSPSTAGLDRRKRGHFADAGTIEFWQVDPALRQIQRFVFAENRNKPVALIDEPETFTTALLPGLILATSEIFRP